MQVFSVLIIGAGRIGAGFDSPLRENVLTHAHAFSKHEGYSLLGFVDKNLEQAQCAVEMWGGFVFGSIGEAFARHSVDIAVVAVPDELHCQVLLELATYPLKLVFTEKPLAKKNADAEDVVGLYHERAIPLAINYSRRYLPVFVSLRNQIAAGEFGGFLVGSGYYGKGLLHNGSHMVDLLRFLIGEVLVLKNFGSIIDWRDDDPTLSALLEVVGGGRFAMQGVDCRYYTVFEMDLFFERARIRLVDSGFAIEVDEVSDSAVFTGYRVLSGVDRRYTDLGGALFCAVSALYNYLTAGVPLPCTGDDGLSALKVCAAIIKGA